MKYQRKQNQVDAIQFDPSPVKLTAIKDFIGDHGKVIHVSKTDATIHFFKNEESTSVRYGDYLMKSGEEVWACRREFFEDAYELITSLPNVQAQR